MNERKDSVNNKPPIYVFTWHFGAEASSEGRKQAIEFVTREMNYQSYLWWEIKWIRRWRNPLDYFETGYRIRVRYKTE